MSENIKRYKKEYKFYKKRDLDDIEITKSSLTDERRDIFSYNNPTEIIEKYERR